MANIYYSDNLAAERLKRCYDIAPPRVRQYLQAELDFVLDRVRPGDVILDLGRGYGGADLESRLRRILFSTRPKAARSTSRGAPHPPLQPPYLSSGERRAGPPGRRTRPQLMPALMFFKKG